MNPNEPIDYSDMTIAHLEQVIQEKDKEIESLKKTNKEKSKEIDYLIDVIAQANNLIKQINTRVDNLRQLYNEAQ